LFQLPGSEYIPIWPQIAHLVSEASNLRAKWFSPALHGWIILIRIIFVEDHKAKLNAIYEH